MKGKDGIQVLRVRAMIGLTSLFPVFILPAHACRHVQELRPEIDQLFAMKREIVNDLGVRIPLCTMCWRF